MFPGTCVTEEPIGTRKYRDEPKEKKQKEELEQSCFSAFFISVMY